MAEAKSFFTDGEAYERSTGRWSRAAGDIFLDWLSLPGDLRWLDVGYGTGVLTELLLQRRALRSISAIDPSADQIAFAKSIPRSAGSTIVSPTPKNSRSMTICSTQRSWRW